MPAPLVRELADSTVLVAGGTSGIGLASATAYGRAGVRRIAILGRNEERGRGARLQVETQCPGAEVLFIAADAMKADDVQRAVDATVSAFGSLDVVVGSTASSFRPELIQRMPAEDLGGTLNAMVLPPMLLTHAAMAVMKEQGGGSIINIASDAAKVATPGESALGASMAAIVMFSRVAAIEGKRDGIRVNAVTPSLVLGTATAEHVLSDGFSKKLFEKAAALAHLGVAEPEDLASLIVFLGSPAASKLTGQAISVNGGISAA
jgi:NAD(P)-dependent dehydrogenase (short-subunit alcohol dehydrogenase family)